MKTLALDFDGVIHSYVSGWKHAGVCEDPPVPGAMAALQEYVKKYTVCIFSSRSADMDGIEAMKRYIRLNLVDEFGDSVGLHIFSKLKFPMDKPPTHLTIDDRGFQFNGEFPTVEYIEEFKPWNKRG